MKNILITGGAGFIGSNLTKSIYAHNDSSISCVDNLSTSSKKNIINFIHNNHYTFIEKDINEPISFDNRKIKEIYHLACPASPLQYQKHPLRTLNTSFIGTKNILDIAVMNKSKLLFTSTSEVYGDPNINPQNESYWGNVNMLGPRACYDEGKRAAETLCYEYKNEFEIDIKIVRLFNTYGPNMAIKDGRLISNIIVQALKGDDLTIFGDGKQTRSFCFVDDLVSGLQLAMKSNDFNNPINLGNPHEVQILEVVSLIREMTNSTSNIVFMETAIDDPRQRRPDISKAKKYLNWEPKIDLKSGLKQTIEYFDSIL